MALVVKNIGYPMAAKLSDMLIDTIKSVYVNRILRSVESDLFNNQVKRKALLKAVKNAKTNDDRDALAALLSKMQ